MSGYHEITIYLRPKQVKSLEKKRTFQLSNADLTSKSGEPYTLRISKKLYTKFNNAIRNNKGLRIIAEFHHEGGGIFDVIKNIGKKVISVVPKPIAKAVVKAGLSGLAGMTGNPALIPLANEIGDIGTDAIYKTQGKGIFDKLKKVGQIATKIIPKEVIQGLANQAIDKVVPKELQGIAKAGSELGVNQGYQSMGNGFNRLHSGQGILDMLFGGSIKVNTKHGKGILDLLFGSGLNPHHGKGILDLLFGGSYKQGKGIFDKLKKVGQIATQIIPKEVVQGLANQAIQNILPKELQGIARAGSELGINQGYQSMGNGLKQLKLNRGGSNHDSNIQFLHTKGNLLNGIQLQNGIKKIRKGGSFLPL